MISLLQREKTIRLNFSIEPNSKASKINFIIDFPNNVSQSMVSAKPITNIF